jgi:hypothetical protein
MAYMTVVGIDMIGRTLACVVIVLSMSVLALSAPISGADYVVGWQDAILAEDYSLRSVYDSESATDGKGNVMAVWVQMGHPYSSIFASLYIAGEGWQEAEPIEDTDAEAVGPIVAMNKAGDAVATWSQINDSTMNWNLWGNVYVKGVGWVGAEPLSPDGLMDDRYPGLVIDSEGTATVVWTRDDTPADVLMIRYDVGVGWSVPTPIDESETADALRSSIGIDGDDNIIVTWVQYEMSAPSIWAKRYDVVDGWGSPEKLADSGMYGGTVLTVGEGGGAVCAWNHENASTTFFEVWACVYEDGVGWGDAIMSGHSTSSNHQDPDVAMDGDGNALVVWWALNGIDDGVYFRPYDAETGWGSDSMMASVSVGEVALPKVAMNGDGNALCVFFHYDSVMGHLRGTVYGTDGMWAPSVIISEDTLGAIHEYTLTINEDGSGLALWSQDDSSTVSVWSAEYQAADTTPPSVVIESPEDGSTVGSSTVTVTGNTEAGVYLTVNGISVAVESDGSFACNIAIIEGENTITATATDPADNSASVSITVTYVLPEDPLLDDIEEVLQSLNDTAAELNETRDDLAGAQEDLDDAKGRIDALSSQILMLGAVVVLFAVISLITLAMYLNLRRHTGGRGGSPSEHDEPPPPE